MILQRIRIAVLMCLLGCSQATADDDEDRRTASVFTTVHWLKTQGADAHAQLARDRHVVIDALIKLIRQPLQGEPNEILLLNLQRQAAMEQLGNLRAEEAAPLLTEMLMETRVLDMASDDPLYSFPAAQAIAQINGRRANNALEKYLTRKVTHNELKLVAWIVYRWDGKEIGRARVSTWVQTHNERMRGKHAIGTQDKNKSANLEALWSLIKDMTFESSAEYPKVP